MTQSDQDFEKGVEKARERFYCPTYTIKDQYNDPDAPYFVAAYYISARSIGALPIARVHARVGGGNDGQ